AGEHDLVLVDGVARSVRNAVDRPLEPGIGKCLDLAAVATNEVMVVVTVGRRGLVARDPVTRVDTLYQAQLGQSLERAVPRRNPDRPARFPEPVEDLLCAEATVLATEQLDDGAARPAAPVAGIVEHGERVGCQGP